MISNLLQIFCGSLLAFFYLGSFAQFSSGELEEAYSQYVKNDELPLCHIDLEGALMQEGVQTLNPMIWKYYDDPYALPIFLTRISGMMLKNHIPFVERSQYAFRILGAPAGGIGPPLAGLGQRIHPCSSGSELQAVINELISDQIILEDLNLNSSWQKIDFKGQNLIIYLIRVMDEANHLFKEFENSVMNNPHCMQQEEVDVRASLMQPIYHKEMRSFPSIAFYEDADMRKLSFASRILMQHIMNAIKMLEGFSVAGNAIAFECNTTYGKVGYYGSADDIIKGTYALIINLGGDDTYNGSVASVQAGISGVGLLIDLDGNDSYRSNVKSSVCRAELGAAVLIDLGGNDSYKVSSPGLANSCFGFSYLFDKAGDDTYVSEGFFSIASAIAGVAILHDAEGDDIFLSGSYSQGFAGPRGIGMLLDQQGNDQYGPYDDGKISFVQGASKGRWAEASDGHSLAGGLGFLIDGSGNDEYFANSFAQGAGYYFGAGFLSDLGGTDVYNAVSHSQAYGVHYALGCLLEATGNDKYNLKADSIRITQIIASGRDHSAGVLVDFRGNDFYQFGNRSLGISDMGGSGIFLDLEGKDNFHHISNSLYKGDGFGGKMFEGEGMMSRFRIVPIETIPAAVFEDQKLIQ